MHSINPEKKHKFNILPWFTIGVFSINLLVLTLSIFNASLLKQVNNQIPSVLGQLTDGRAITLAPQAHYQRHSETIRKFVGETFILIFTSSKQRPPLNTFKHLSNLFAPQLQTQLKSQIQLDKNQKTITSVFIIEKISQPQIIKPGVWQLNINARRIIFDNQDMTGKSINWHKKLILQATENPQIQPNSSGESLHQVTNRLQKMQLQITNICDLNIQSCTHS